MKGHIFAALAISIFLISSVQAATFLNVYLDDSGSALFLGDTTDSSLGLPEGVGVNDTRVFGSTQDLTSKEGEVWTFSYSLEDSEIELVFPKGARLINSSAGEIFLENNQIFIYFKEEIEVSYVIEEIEETGNNKNNNRRIFVLVIILAIIIYSIFRDRKEKAQEKNEKQTPKKEKKTNKKDKLELIKKVLSPREKSILDSLKKYGKIKQTHLRKITEIPKASLSRHIQELEKKGLVKRSGEGKNKFIELK